MIAARRTLLALAGLTCLAACSSGEDAPAAPAATATPASPAKPALTVTVASPESRDMERRLTANGSIAAWQEASLGAESGGLRLIDVKVNVGARVKRGELLAEFAADIPLADQAQARAALARPRAALQEARGNAGHKCSCDRTVGSHGNIEPPLLLKSVQTRLLLIF